MAVAAVNEGTFQQEHQGSDVQSEGKNNLKHGSNHLTGTK
jgi:hypothetical protein